MAGRYDYPMAWLHVALVRGAQHADIRAPDHHASWGCVRHFFSSAQIAAAIVIEVA